MTHLAVTGSSEGKLVTWTEKVADEQYNAAGAAAEPTVARMTGSFRCGSWKWRMVLAGGLRGVLIEMGR